jgi:hypothetical protein
MDIYRHGDVIIAPVDSLPENAAKRSGLILARGELTGHSHRIEPDGAAELYESGDSLFLHVTDSPASVTHEEHNVIRLPPGIYKVWRQREYDPRMDERWIED